MAAGAFVVEILILVSVMLRRILLLFPKVPYQEHGCANYRLSRGGTTTQSRPRVRMGLVARLAIGVQ